MSIEECPYCGKPFKRLKTHIPHCKMAPATQPKKSIQAPKDLSASGQKVHKKTATTQTNYGILEDRIPSKNRSKEDIHTTAGVNVSSAGTLNTERPKSKWLAKRQKELERLQLLVPVSQKPSNSASLSEHEGGKSFFEISKGLDQGTSQTNGKGTKGKKKLKMPPLSEQLSITKNNIISPGFVPEGLKNSFLPSKLIVQHEHLNLETKAGSLEELKRPTNNQSKDIDPVSGVHTLFGSKTSVWDHISDSLYYKKSYLFVPYPVMKKSKDISTVQQPNKLETAVSNVSVPPSYILSETANQQAAEDILNSRLHGVKGLSWCPEIVTDCKRIQFPTIPLGSYDNGRVWMMDQFVRPSTASKVPLAHRKLGDVQLNELGVWLGARTPVSPTEIVTMFKQGWQWYYRKYIDVRRGGIGGIAMLLTGYCALCYIWNYPHLKKDRWRKYH